MHGLSSDHSPLLQVRAMSDLSRPAFTAIFYAVVNWRVKPGNLATASEQRLLTTLAHPLRSTAITPLKPSGNHSRASVASMKASGLRSFDLRETAPLFLQASVFINPAPVTVTYIQIYVYARPGSNLGIKGCLFGFKEIIREPQP